MTNSQEIEVLARTIYGEARGEYFHPHGGLASLIAVGNVVMNRVKKKGWFGKTIEEVCRKSWQFSCWNANDPNFRLLQKPCIDDSVFKICQDVAESVAAERWPDLTGGCTHYHSTTLKDMPAWTKDQRPRLNLGRHVFYRIER